MGKSGIQWKRNSLDDKIISYQIHQNFARRTCVNYIIKYGRFVLFYFSYNLLNFNESTRFWPWSQIIKCYCDNRFSLWQPDSFTEYDYIHLISRINERCEWKCTEKRASLLSFFFFVGRFRKACLTKICILFNQGFLSKCRINEVNCPSFNLVPYDSPATPWDNRFLQVKSWTR